MLVDLVLKGKSALVVGGGYESEHKVQKLLDSGATVTVIANDLTARLTDLEESDSINVLRKPLSDAIKSIAFLKPYVFMAFTGRPKLDDDLANAARSCGAIVYVVDRPDLNDFNMPAVAVIGDFRIAISTGGMSPAMAGILRRRIEKVIKLEDLLQVKLQNHLRKILKKEVRVASYRKALLYKIIEDKKTTSLLHQNQLDKAKAHAENIMKKSLPWTS